MPLGLIIPRSAAETRRYYKCFCGKAFPLDRKSQFVRHAQSCTKKHGDEIEEQAERRKNNGFLSPSDKELYDHIRRGGS